MRFKGNDKSQSFQLILDIVTKVNSYLPKREYLGGTYNPSKPQS
jgi:hypothetical protein